MKYFVMKLDNISNIIIFHVTCPLPDGARNMICGLYISCEILQWQIQSKLFVETGRLPNYLHIVG